jgi:translation initiation factor 2B subunit (eIF-2B alpha/beta/delta family)
MIAFSQLLEAGVAGLVDAITSLENELRETRHTVVSLQERIRMLEETGSPTNESDLETLIDDRIDSALDMRLDDAIESALSGREIEVTLSGSATL